MNIKKPFPKTIPFRKLLGPSFIILALGLGSGEVILWPFLVSIYGLGIAWGAMLGITFQYFMNMEIERYALVKGESVFVGLNKKFKAAVPWFIISTFIGFGIPGIIAASAKVASHILGLSEHKWIAIVFLLVIGMILSLGKTVYGMMEKITETVLLLGTPFIFFLAIILASKSDWIALGKGLIGIGESLSTQPSGYILFPIGISLATFLAAFAYAGAGGNLNLTQSIYVKEKGYGMGKYSQRMVGLFRNKSPQTLKLEGEECDFSNKSVNNFKKWWRLVSAEHLIVFWFMGLLTMTLLMLLSYSSTFGKGISGAADISFVITESTFISAGLSPVFGTIFLIVVVIMLFQTQLGVLDSTSRIMAENYSLKKMEIGKKLKINLSKTYYIFLWAQIIFGVVLFLADFKEPLTLIVIGAVINAVAMFVHLGLVSWMNFKVLPQEVQAPLWRKVIIILIFLFLGIFSVVTIYTQLSKLF
ncbi:Nramp family divalent metal transporter [Candidatus Woesearchaeota archaeon]|nr:Nramp family divalent metal transporter [Candidatus Woesearchaeota archaeon]